MSVFFHIFTKFSHSSNRIFNDIMGITQSVIRIRKVTESPCNPAKRKERRDPIK